jgi:GAF domain-containing protein
MSENITMNFSASKPEKYQSLLPQIAALIEGESDLTANLGNISSTLYFGMDFFWVGVYIVKNETLILGPFQGPVACTRIAKGKGVCGTAWQNAETIIVPDVEQFQGHIACSSLAKSEIVVPILKNGEVIAVLDIDSEFEDMFDETDKMYLEELCKTLAGIF